MCLCGVEVGGGTYGCEGVRLAIILVGWDDCVWCGVGGAYGCGWLW